MERALILYTRERCGLCAQAAAIAAAAGVEVRPVDIGGDIELLMRYRDSIPVISDPGSAAEIRWPFDAAALVAFRKALADPAGGEVPP